MKKGDLVHNASYDKYGVILDCFGYYEAGDGSVAEEVFTILWSDGTIGTSGDSFLEKVG
jgi:hypothetical protein